MEVNYEEVIAGKEKIGGSKESIGSKEFSLSLSLSLSSPPLLSLFPSLLLFNFTPLAFLLPAAPFKVPRKKEGKGLARMSRAS